MVTTLQDTEQELNVKSSNREKYHSVANSC